MGDAYLGEFEHLVLLAVLRLGDDAHGAAIRRLIEERAERSVSFGAVYSTLRRLQAKGLLVAAEELRASPAGGRPRRLLRITPAGESAVAAAQRRLRRMSADLGLAQTATR